MAKLRREIPDIALRTTFISGFPGETEEDHEILMEFVDDMEFDRLGVFAYSPEEDTPAYSFKDQVPDEVKEERRAEIMELQQDIAFEKSEIHERKRSGSDDRGKGGRRKRLCGPHLYGQPRRGRADLCEHRAFPDVRGLCTGPGHRRSGI